MNLFHTVTSADFMRSFRWAAGQRNEVADQINQAKAQHMKAIQRAKFFPGGLHSIEGPEATRVGSVIQPAIVEIEGIQWESFTPKSAAEAERINKVIDRWQGASE